MEKNKNFTIKKITGKLELLSGLHIGGGDTEMHIGGVDNSVIKDPITSEPYIPGSSLKGKVRSLLEYLAGAHTKNGGKPLSASTAKSEIEKTIVRLFGTGGGSSKNTDGNSDSEEFGITRLVFSDCYLNEDSKKEILSTYGKFTEIKAENSIDRLSGTAENPRFTERVVKGAKFDFSVSIRLLQGDNTEELIETFLKGLKLLNYDALGGSGSRGYGKVSIMFDDKEIQERFDRINFEA